MIFWTNLVAWSLIAVAFVGILITASYDRQNCLECDGKEGYLCWLITIPLFLGIMILYIGLIILSFQMKY